ncbi:MAG TPA: hydroxyacylglutathione hydrolase [bacterium]|nr:hydroxyacylglutathione hydrolase [bacterium]
MRVMPIPCLQDNYAYLVICEETGQAAVVDPSEAAPVLRALQEAKVELVAILNTHHHWDHVGGNKELLAKFPRLEVYGHSSDKGRIEGQTRFLESGDTFRLGKLDVRVLHNPGHTTGAVSYVIDGNVFTGDTLFAGGCGRLFEGTPEMMYESLCKVIGALPEHTKVHFGHEYTENNLRFAASVEPDNRDVQEKLEAVRKLRAAGKFSTPSTLAEEWRTNPFMRVDSTTIQASVKKADPDNDLSPVHVLAVVRELKNRF